MTKKLRFISLLLTLVMLFGVMTSAGMIPAGAASKIIGTLSIKVGETKKLSFTDPGGNPVSVRWKSENKKIASVSSDGNVTAKKAGTVVIKTTWNNRSYGVNIKVTGKATTAKTQTKKTTTKKTTATKTTSAKFKLSKTSLILKKGKKATVSLKKAVASKVKWSVKNKKIVAVKKGKITAKKAGTTTVTAKYKKKSYKCKVRVYSMKTLGTKKVTAGKNTAKIKGVQITFSPLALKKTAKTTLKKVSGLPKLGNAKMKTYDFSIKNAKVTKDDVALIEIPYKAKKGKIPIAGYYNEKKNKWESVPCDYDGKNISIVTNHFSPFGVGEISSAFNNYVMGKHTTTAFVLDCWVPKTPSITGERAVQIMTGAMNSAQPTTSCTEMGFDAVNQLFDYTVNWGANLTSAFGFTDKFTIATGNLSNELGAIGFVLSYVSAVRYALKGDKYNAVSTALQGTLSLATGIGFAWIGTAASSAAAFAVTFVSYALNKGYSDMLDANEKKWFDVFNTYYKKGGAGYRSPAQWRDALKPIIEDTSLSAEQRIDLIKDEVESYSRELWDKEEEIAMVFNSTQTKSLKGGLNEALKTKLSNYLQSVLYNGNVKLVFEWYSKKSRRDAEEAAEKTFARIAEMLSETTHIRFKDKSISQFEDSDLEGWIVRWKNIPSVLKDKERLELKLDKSGDSSTYYTVYAALCYGIKPVVEICTPKGKVIDTMTLKYKDKFNTYNVMTSKVKSYLNSVKVELNKTSLTLQKGKTYKLKLKNAKASKVSWSSSNRDVATVDSGKVYGRKDGKTTITAKYKGKKYKCKVTVKKAHYVWKLISAKDVTFKDNITGTIASMSGSRGSFSYNYHYTYEDNEGNKRSEFHSAYSKLSGIKDVCEPGKKYTMTLNMGCDHSDPIHWSLHANYEITFWSDYELNDNGIPYGKGIFDDAYRTERASVVDPEVNADSSFYRNTSVNKDYTYYFSDYNDPENYDGEKRIICVKFESPVVCRQYTVFEYQFVKA